MSFIERTQSLFFSPEISHELSKTYFIFTSLVKFSFFIIKNLARFCRESSCGKRISIRMMIGPIISYLFFMSSDGIKQNILSDGVYHKQGYEIYEYSAYWLERGNSHQTFQEDQWLLFWIGRWMLPRCTRHYPWTQN